MAGGRKTSADPGNCSECIPPPLCGAGPPKIEDHDSQSCASPPPIIIVCMHFTVCGASAYARMFVMRASKQGTIKQGR